MKESEAMVRQLQRDVEYYRDRLNREREVYAAQLESVRHQNEALIKLIADGHAFDPPPPMYFCAKCAVDLPLRQSPQPPAPEGGA